MKPSYFISLSSVFQRLKSLILLTFKFNFFVLFFICVLSACSRKDLPLDPDISTPQTDPKVTNPQEDKKPVPDRAEVTEGEAKTETAMKKSAMEKLLAEQNLLLKRVMALNQAVLESTELTKNTPFGSIEGSFRNTPEDLYEKEVSDPVTAFMEEKHTRSALAVLEDKGLGALREEPYEFKSPEGEFLQKNQELYEKLREANPFHEQGIRARSCGLSAVEVADEEHAKGREKTRDLAYRVADSLLRITMGALPLGEESQFYAFCTGKNLFTGADVKNLLNEGETFEKEGSFGLNSADRLEILTRIREGVIEKPVPSGGSTQSNNEKGGGLKEDRDRL